MEREHGETLRDYLGRRQAAINNLDRRGQEVNTDNLGDVAMERGRLTRSQMTCLRSQLKGCTSWAIVANEMHETFGDDAFEDDDVPKAKPYSGMTKPIYEVMTKALAGGKGLMSAPPSRAPRAPAGGSGGKTTAELESEIKRINNENKQLREAREKAKKKPGQANLNKGGGNDARTKFDKKKNEKGEIAPNGQAWYYPPGGGPSVLVSSRLGTWVRLDKGLCKHGVDCKKWIECQQINWKDKDGVERVAWGCDQPHLKSDCAALFTKQDEWQKEWRQKNPNKQVPWRKNTSKGVLRSDLK
jgi:hypothetical protein